MKYVVFSHHLKSEWAFIPAQNQPFSSPFKSLKILYALMQYIY
jgi:hypothetical protein